MRGAALRAAMTAVERACLPEQKRHAGSKAVVAGWKPASRRLLQHGAPVACRSVTTRPCSVVPPHQDRQYRADSSSASFTIFPAPSPAYSSFSYMYTEAICRTVTGPFGTLTRVLNSEVNETSALA